MKKTAFDELIAAIRSDDTARQEEAANKICALHDPASLQFILAALKKNDPLTRRVMLWALRNYSAELEYAQYLSYLADEDLGVREAALRKSVKHSCFYCIFFYLKPSLFS